MLKLVSYLVIPSVHTAEPSRLHVAANMALEQPWWERLFNVLTVNPLHTEICTYATTYWHKDLHGPASIHTNKQTQDPG